MAAAGNGEDATCTTTIYEVSLNTTGDCYDDQQLFFESRNQGLEYLRTFLLSSDRVWKLHTCTRDSQDIVISNDCSHTFDESMSFKDIDEFELMHHPGTPEEPHEIHFGTIQLKPRALPDEY